MFRNIRIYVYILYYYYKIFVKIIKFCQLNIPEFPDFPAKNGWGSSILRRVPDPGMVGQSQNWTISRFEDG